MKLKKMYKVGDVIRIRLNPYAEYGHACLSVFNIICHWCVRLSKRKWNDKFDMKLIVKQ